jgi:DNA primase
MNEKLSILSRILGSHYQTNDEHLFFCPYCKHEKRKFSVNLRRNVYKCWICNQRGRSLYRVVRRFGSFKDQEGWRALTGAPREDLSLFETLFEAQKEEEIIQVVDLPKDFKSLTRKKLDQRGKRMAKYLENRGIDKKDILQWKIGYCSQGRYRDRVIFPSFNESGNPNYFVARSITEEDFKYLNPAASRNIIFNELYLDFDKEITIVEGIFDAMKAGNAVPILGSTLSENSLLFKKIIKHDTPILLALDKDAKWKAVKIKRLLLKYGIEVRELDLEEYEDVGEMSKDEFNRLSSTASFIQEDDILVSLLSDVS